MKKLTSTLPNMILSLGIICLIIASILAWVNSATKETIAQAETKAKVEAIGAVVPEFDNDPFAEKQEVVLESEPNPIIVYPATKDGQPVGYAIETYTKNGFSGNVEIMVGFDTESNIVGYSVLKHAETPGLGAKMQEWFSSPAPQEGLIRDMRGVNMAKESPLKVSKDGGKVDAITAATISSRAFLDAIERAYRAYQTLTGGDKPQAVATTEPAVEGDPHDCSLPDRAMIDSLFLTILPDCRLVAKEQIGMHGEYPYMYQDYGTKDMTDKVGSVVVTNSDIDYGGRCLPMIVCFDAQGKLSAFAFFKENARHHTPLREHYGVDSKGKPGSTSLVGQKITSDVLKLKEDGGSLDAISGSTVSTRAFLQTLNRASSIYKEVHQTKK